MSIFVKLFIEHKNIYKNVEAIYVYLDVFSITIP